MRKAPESNPDIYDIDFTIDTLAEQTGISSRLISYTVNACGGKNFSRMLAEFRVREACRILKVAETPVMRPTMDALAQMVGYKSRTHLTRVFKAELGLTPAEYMAPLT